MTVVGVDDFASMREVVHRRYKRILENMNAKPGQADPLRSQMPGAQSLTRHHGSRVGDHEQQPSDVDSPQMPGAPRLDSETWDTIDAGSYVLNEASAPQTKKTKEPATMPSLILIDGGLGQLHAAADALESLGFTSQPLASIAKREEVIYLYGNEDEPIVLDRRSPVLHLIQLIRDESHRFAVGYHRQRRAMRDRDSELLNIPGVGAQTRQRLLTHFGSLRDVQQATAESLAAVVPRKTADAIWKHFHESQPARSGA
jgi:excinuclease UvrABC nuclease subunit